MHAGRALAERGMFLAHALAQALGGRFGASHGAMNALCLAPALRFNEPVVPDAIATFARALGVADAPRRVEELARLGGFERLRDLGIPEDGARRGRCRGGATPGRALESAPCDARRRRGTPPLDLVSR